MVAAFIATALAQDHADAAKAQWRQVADQVRPKLPKLAELLDEAEEDVLAYMTFPKEHRAKIHSTNPPASETKFGRRSLSNSTISASANSRTSLHRFASIETHLRRCRCP